MVAAAVLATLDEPRIVPGGIPSGWSMVALPQITERISVGIATAATHAYRNRGVPMFRNQDIRANKLLTDDLLYLDPAYEAGFRTKRLRAADILVARTGYAGTAAVVPDAYAGAQCFTTLIVTPLVSRVRPEFLCAIFNSEIGTRFFAGNQIGGGQKNIGVGIVTRFVVPLPDTLREQDAIVEIVLDTNAQLESAATLVAKKRALRNAVMRDLLLGLRRLPGFNGRWVERRIGDLAVPITERNSSDQDWPVVTCSKHLGFVDSLEYFKNQVYSQDTSTYKVIRRGQIGYPANHIEEGSIGIQEKYDAALVSPIYVVFAVRENMDSYYLHRLLKLDAFRAKFQAQTASSVDRRGSLRWPSFSEIVVNTPDLEEQHAIVAVLRSMDAEIEALEKQLTKAQLIAHATQQQVLTGRTRLK